jgi:UDP-N-acetylglucosamine transferase subunit ALG13
MIFVTVGTNEARFDRLLRAIGALPLDEDMLIQHGHSPPIGRPGSELVDFFSFEAMAEAIQRSRVVVTHAGVGSVMVSLANGKRPIVVPRRKAYREAVDDHQLQLGRRFAEAGLVTLVEDTDGLGPALADEQAQRVAVEADPGSLAADLRGFVEGALARPSIPLHP